MQERGEETEDLLHIALQDGFANELVVVTVDGEEIYRRVDVQTDYRIGLADSVEVPLPDHPVTVRVSLPERGMDAAVEVEPEANVYLGVSYLDGTIQYRHSPRPFGYV